MVDQCNDRGNENSRAIDHSQCLPVVRLVVMPRKAAHSHDTINPGNHVSKCERAIRTSTIPILELVVVNDQAENGIMCGRALMECSWCHVIML